MEKIKIVILIILLVFQFSNNNMIFADDLSYESDLEYILTKYLLSEYEEVIRLLNIHYFNYQKELAYLFGLCYLKLNMNRMALHYFNIVLSENENNHEVLNNIGVAYFQENDFLNAMRYFHLSFISNTDYEIAQKNYNDAYESWLLKREFESIRPIIPFTERATMYNSLGWFYYYFGDFHNAIYYFSKTIEEDAGYQFAYLSLAYVYIEGNNFETALNYLLEAKKINENIPDIYNNLGIVYYHLSDYESSENAFFKAISLNNRFVEPHNNLGFLYLETGKYDLSEEYFQKSLDLNLFNHSLGAESTAGLAILNYKNNNIEQARIYKENSLSLDYRMNNIRHLIDRLKWSNELIEIWGKI
jgi:tetratricopeptide (TPR) repeat protein